MWTFAAAPAVAVCVCLGVFLTVGRGYETVSNLSARLLPQLFLYALGFVQCLQN